jgi:hypothetical protein
MKRTLFSLLIFLSYLGAAHAQIGPGLPCGTTAANACYTQSSGGSGGTVTQGPQAATATGNTWFIQQYLAGSAISLTNPEPVTPGTGATFPISATALPLPTGASTAANQTSVQSAPGTPQTTALTVQCNASGVPIPVSISGGSGSQAISYASPGTTVAVTTSSTAILGAAAYTHSLTLCTETTDSGNIYLNLNGGAAVVSSGMYIPALGGCVNILPPTAAIFGISDSGTSHVTIQGG